MKTEADLCNLALARVGQRQQISSLKDSTPQAILCATLYPAARDAVLADHWWRFAGRHAVLADTGETRSGWQYVYALPVDCLEPRFIFSGARPGQPVFTAWSAYSNILGVTSVNQLPPINGAVPSIAFDVEASKDGSSRVLLTDQPSAELIYTAALTTVSAFPTLVQEAIAWKLAQDLALSFTVKPQLALALDAKVREALAKAKAASLRSGAPDVRPNSAAITVRG